MLNRTAVYSDSNGDSLHAIEVITLPENGTLKLDTEEVVANTTIAVADIPQLNFTPAAHANGEAYSEFTFKASDGDSFSNESTLAIHVTAVNDLPVLAANSEIDLGSTQEDTAMVITLAQFIANATDVDTGNELNVLDIVLADPAQGALSDNGDQTWTYTPAANFHGDNVRINFNVNDGTVSIPSFAMVDVASVNDQPEAPPMPLAALEDGPVVGHKPNIVDGDSTDTHSLSIITQPEKGVASISLLPESVRQYGLREDVEDSSGQNAHGTIVSSGDTAGVTFSVDPARGSVADFDGTGSIKIAAQVDDGVNVADGLPVENMTVAAWVKVDKPSINLERLDYTVGGSQISGNTSHHLVFDENYQIGNAFWAVFDNGGYIKGVQLTTEETINGIKFTALKADYEHKTTWNNLTPEQQSIHFDTYRNGGTVATSESAAGYGIKNISINNGEVIGGFVNTTNGVTLGPYSTSTSGFFGVIQGYGQDESIQESEAGWLIGNKGASLNFSLVTEGKTITHVTDPSASNLGNWNHVAATYDGSTTKLFVNGSEAANSTEQSGNILYPDLSSAIFQIGAYKDNNEDRHFDGKLSDIRLYDRALDASNIQDLMDGKHPGINYDPGAHFQELDGSETEAVTFTYQATDDSGADNAISEEATVTVTVTGVNDAPTLALGDEHLVHTAIAGKQFLSDAGAANPAPGPNYSMSLEQGGNALSLLEPQFISSALYYTVDTNQDNKIDAADTLDMGALGEMLSDSDTIQFDDHVLTLPTQATLDNNADLDVVKSLMETGLNVWTSDNGNYALYDASRDISVEHDYANALVMLQVIG